MQEDPFVFNKQVQEDGEYDCICAKGGWELHMWQQVKQGNMLHRCSAIVAQRCRGTSCLTVDLDCGNVWRPPHYPNGKPQSCELDLLA